MSCAPKRNRHNFCSPSSRKVNDMVAACALSQRKEESKNKRDFKNDGKSQTFMNSQHGLEKNLTQKKKKGH
jgi:hypothetical protein